MCEKGEHNYVADAQNWEQRIKGEIEAARAWEAQWGDLFYSKREPRTYEGKIERIEHEMRNLPVQRMMTNSMIDYIPVKPYPEWYDHKRKSFEKLILMSELTQLEEEEKIIFQKSEHLTKIRQLETK